MRTDNGRFVVFGNAISRADSRRVARRQAWLKRKFHYDASEVYSLRAVDNPELGSLLGLKDIVRSEQGEPIDRATGVICSTIRMGYGHFRIAMAAASCARAMGLTPYWLDLLAIPGVTTDVIRYCNRNYSFFSRLSQRSRIFEKYIWEPVTTGEPALPILSNLLNAFVVSWPWRFLKTNVKDFAMSELFRNLHQALPADMPVLTSHMWNCMGAVAAGMTNVVDMMFDNWPMAFQITEGARHGVQSPSGYYGFRAMRGFDEHNRPLKAMPPDSLFYVGHHVDHEIVENIEGDCAARLRRMRSREPRRLLLSMGGAGAHRELFRAIIDHCLPLIRDGKVALFVNLGDHKSNWEWLQGRLGEAKSCMQTHLSWAEARSFADQARTRVVEGLHIFLFDNTFHAVYATNYLMRVVDVMITKPSELAFYPVPKIFNPRVGGHEMWGAIRSAELGDGTVEARSVRETLQAIDLVTQADDLMELFCSSIVKNKTIGIYDGAYRCVSLATGRPFVRGAAT